MLKIGSFDNRHVQGHTIWDTALKKQTCMLTLGPLLKFLWKTVMLLYISPEIPVVKKKKKKKEAIPIRDGNSYATKKFASPATLI